MDGSPNPEGLGYSHMALRAGAAGNWEGCGDGAGSTRLDCSKLKRHECRVPSRGGRGQGRRA